MILQFFVILFSVVITIIFTKAAWTSFKDNIINPWKDTWPGNKLETHLVRVFLAITISGILTYILILLWLGTLTILEM